MGARKATKNGMTGTHAEAASATPGSEVAVVKTHEVGVGATAPVIPAQGVSIEALLSSAVANGVPVETMERLLAMRRELKAEAAKEAFDLAMAGFQSECPTIQKTKEVRTRAGIVAYSFAPIESIVQQVRHLLKQYGFSYSFRMENTEEGVKVVCRVVHSAGHSEETPMEVPIGNKTDVMSNSQVTAAATTFAKRYAFLNAFGIMTGDEDTDGANTDGDQTAASKDSPDRLKRTIGMQLVQLGHNIGKMTKQQADDTVMKLTGLDMIPENFQEVILRLSVMVSDKNEAGKTITHD